jgi:threonine/homoserine/homoserine lactone efflux protein
MKENVGPKDRAVRSLLGPSLLVLAVTRLGARRGRLAGLAALVGGALVIDSAITKTCPLNAAAGIETP